MSEAITPEPDGACEELEEALDEELDAELDEELDDEPDDELDAELDDELDELRDALDDEALDEELDSELDAELEEESDAEVDPEPPASAAGVPESLLPQDPRKTLPAEEPTSLRNSRRSNGIVDSLNSRLSAWPPRPGTPARR